MVLSPQTKFAAGRFLNVFAIAKGNPPGALAVAEGRGTDYAPVVTACKAVVSAGGSSDYPAASPVAESFLALMRPYSIALQLATFMRAVPMRTRLYVSLAGPGGAEVAEGQAVPVSKGDYTAQDLKPRNFAAMIVRTLELATNTSPVATQGVADELAQATADVENTKFVSPTVAGSIFNGQQTFAGTGSTVDAIDADLKHLVDLVPSATLPGAHFIMTKETATALSLKRGSGGSAAYPTISPQGGTLMGLPVLVTPAMEQAGTRYIGLVAPSQVLWAHEGAVQLSASTEAAIQQTDAPTNNSRTSTGTTLVSLYQTESIALKAVRQSNWYAKPGAAAYFSTTY